MDRDAFQQLLESVDVQDWLDAQGIDYKRGSAGQLLLKECPFCGRAKWKVSMREDNGRGRCYSGSCDQGFNLFSFARAHLQCDSRATFAHFEDFARASYSPVEAAQLSPAIVTPLDWKLPSSTPLPTPEGHTHPYLIDRRITPETQSFFGLRFCASGVYRYVDFDGNPRMMDFSQRILLPVFDLDGSLQTFQGRDVTGDADKRYLFPPLLPGSGRFLYGGHKVRGYTHLVIGEGPFDALAIHQSINGLPEFKGVGAVGSFGLSIGHGHERGDDQLGRIRDLKHDGLREVTFMWDAEPGALKKALEAGRLLRAEGLRVRIALLPPEQDPASVATEVVRQAIRQAQPLTDALYLQWSLRSPL